MGLVVNLERWPMPAAIALATEGVRSNYNSDCGGGGFGASDREIGCKIDGAKVLSVIDSIAKIEPHLSDWCLFAYASDGWASKSVTSRLINHIASDWVFRHSASTGLFVQKRTYDMIVGIIPIIAGGVAIEQSSGAMTEYRDGNITYKPAIDRSSIISQMAKHDSLHSGDSSQSFLSSRRRHYQNNWSRVSCHIDEIKSIITAYDTVAQKIFKKLLENKMRAI